MIWEVKGPGVRLRREKLSHRAKGGLRAHAQGHLSDSGHGTDMGSSSFHSPDCVCVCVTLDKSLMTCLFSPLKNGETPRLTWPSGRRTVQCLARGGWSPCAQQ